MSIQVEPAGDACEVQDVNFADPAFLADPFAPIARLQNEAPVFYSEIQKGWIISRHEDVRAVLADRRFLSSRVKQLFRGMPPEIEQQVEALKHFMQLNVVRLDGRDHTRIRVPMLKAFDRALVRKFEDFIAEIVNEILDDCERLGEFDFFKVVGEVLPTSVIQKLFDLPRETPPMLFKLASDFVSASGAATMTPELLLQLDRSIQEMNQVFVKLVSEREETPGEDLVSTMIHARDGLNKLSNDEMLAQFHGVVAAGAETTANTLATQVIQIVRNPELLGRLRADPGCAFNLVTELLRYPGTVKCMTRLAGEDIEYRGQLIREGDLVWVMHVGANIDPSIFPEPYKTDIDRPNLRDAMSFGPGFHFCIGNMLARTELTTFFIRAFDRFDIEILQEDFDMVPSYVFYGFKELKVRFTPRR